jgi:nicotinamide-nucleotide amidase
LKPTAKLLDHVTRCLHEFNVPDEVFFWDLDKICEELRNLSVKKGITLSGAESMTGGLISSYITRVPGSSDYFKGSAVVYHADAKIRILSVERELIEAKGVVSEEVAAAMAEGARKLFRSDASFGITGYAGPPRGDEDREIGTTCVSLLTPRDKVTWTAVFEGNREEVRNLGSSLVLYCLYVLVLRI